MQCLRIQNSLLCVQEGGEGVTEKFSEQLTWKFANLKKFKWMELVHPTKLESRKKAAAAWQLSFFTTIINRINTSTFPKTPERMSSIMNLKIIYPSIFMICILHELLYYLLRSVVNVIF